MATLRKKDNQRRNQAAEAFGYSQKYHPTIVQQLVLKKRATIKKMQEIEKLFEQVGLKKPKKETPLDVETARLLVNKAKATFGKNPLLLTSQKAANLLGTDYRTIKRLAKKGVLTHFTINYGSISTAHYFDRKQLFADLHKPEVKEALMREVEGKSPQVRKKREELVERLRENAKTLLIK